jgi:cystathionine beta-synthase
VETVADVLRAMPRREVITVEASQKLSDAVSLFKNEGISQLPVVDQGRLAGILTESDVLHALVSGKARGDSALAEVMERRVSTVSPATRATELPEIFERGEVALVVDADQLPVGILTKLDLIDFMTRTPSVA